jgi:hypothetical protein
MRVVYKDDITSFQCRKYLQISVFKAGPNYHIAQIVNFTARLWVYRGHTGWQSVSGNAFFDKRRGIAGANLEVPLRFPLPHKMAEQESIECWDPTVPESGEIASLGRRDVTKKLFH